MKKLTKAQKRQAIKDKWFNGFFLVGMILFFAFTFWFAYNSYLRYDIMRSIMLAKFENKELTGQQICMFRNELKMGPATPVLIDGETYYVCCQMCADKLKLNYQDSQFAVDEYSHHRIKKSKAFIVLTKKNEWESELF